MLNFQRKEKLFHFLNKLVTISQQCKTKTINISEKKKKKKMGRTIGSEKHKNKWKITEHFEIFGMNYETEESWKNKLIVYIIFRFVANDTTMQILITI